MIWVSDVAHIREKFIKGCIGESWRKVRHKHRWEANIKMDQEMGWGGWTWLIWLRTGTDGGCSRVWQWTFGFPKIWGNIMITRGPCRFWKASAPRSLFIVVFYFIHHKWGGTEIWDIWGLWWIWRLLSSSCICIENMSDNGVCKFLWNGIHFQTTWHLIP